MPSRANAATRAVGTSGMTPATGTSGMTRARASRTVPGVLTGLPLYAVIGEPVARLGWKIPERGGMRVRPGDPQPAGAADVGRPLVAAVEHDLLERWWPAKKQPPAALGARPLIDAGFRRFRPRHLMCDGQPNSDLPRAC